MIPTIDFTRCNHYSSVCSNDELDLVSQLGFLMFVIPYECIDVRKTEFAAQYNAVNACSGVVVVVRLRDEQNNY